MSRVYVPMAPVDNGGAYWHESIRSILRQTFQDFEFLIVDDGSSDCFDVAVVRPFDDPRIRLVRNPR